MVPDILGIPITNIALSCCVVGATVLLRKFFFQSNTNGKFKLHGWDLSYFTGKARSYLIFKGVDFELVPMSFIDLQFIVPLKTGVKIMPVLETPEGTWIQDTRDIIDAMDKRFPISTVYPEDPLLLFISNLLEAWGDEWFIPHAMHPRWNNDENIAFFKKEAGVQLFPWGPDFLRSMGADLVANILKKGFCPKVGIRPNQLDQLDCWTMAIMQDLNIHFAATPYLLGNRPTIGDFGLVGSMYAHFFRDPFSRRTFVDPFPHVLDWINRMQSLNHSQIEELYPHPDLSLPPTLNPILIKVMAEFVPMIESINSLMVTFHQDPKYRLHGRPVPRLMGEVTFPMGGKPFSRMGLPFPLWKMQGTMDVFHRMSEEDKTRTRIYLHQFGEGAERLLQLKLPRMQRCTVTVKFV